MDNQEWLDWVVKDEAFKAETRVRLTELSKANEKIMTNHLPHIQDSLDDNKVCTMTNSKSIDAIKDMISILKDSLKSTRRWIWAIIGVGILILLESDRIPQLLEIIKRFLP